MQLALGDLLASEARLQKELDAAVAQAKKDASGDAGGPGAPAERAKPKGRRDLLASKLPRFVVEIRDEEMEAQGCRRIGFDDSAQLMYRRGGFVVLAKRVARYEVTDRGTTTAVTVASPVTLFPRGLLHTSTVAPPDAGEVRARRAALPARARVGHQGVPLDRGTMSRYMEQADNALGATVVHAMWADAIANAQVISTDATGALIQPAKIAKDGRADGETRSECRNGLRHTAI